MKKKKILFVNESLACAGGEKSLLNLLSAIDYDKYDVYLQLFKYGYPWDKYIDPHVNVLPPLTYTRFTALGIKKAALWALAHGRLKWLYARLKYSFTLRRKKSLTNPDKACLYWKAQSNCYKSESATYDYVIAYAQGIPTFYVADKTNATVKKLAWVNATYAPISPYKEYIDTKFQKIDIINAVSDPIGTLLQKHWPSISGKVSVFMDLLNPKIVNTLAQELIELKKDNTLTLVTLGRLSAQKGYDILIDAAEVLLRTGLQFKWYILGCGSLEQEIQTNIHKRGLTNNVILLGVKPNPYPYLNLADIYVQTSRLEGFGIAIAEARILNIPVVTTRFNTVYMQMVDGKNGLVTDMNGTAVAEAIMRLNSDRNLYKEIVNYLQTEKKGNLEIIDQFYGILNS